MMPRLAPRIRHDEVTRMVKAAKSCGLAVHGITFDGTSITVITVESTDKPAASLDRGAATDTVPEVETL